MPEHAIELPTAWGKLSGTRLLPDGDGPWTAALLVAGSGPTDRDGNNPLLPAPIDNIKRLAQSLAGRGVASLRYDKRGVGASVYPGLNESVLRFEQLVDDAVLLAEHLGRDARIRNVVLVGHSEGALIAALAAEDAKARALVSIAGAGSRASAVIRRQIHEQLPADLAAPAYAMLDSLERQQAVAEVPDSLVLLFRPTVQDYLMSWFRYDPPEVLGTLQLPVLLLQGSADVQVAVGDARSLQAGKPDAKLVIVEGMDHLLALEGDIGGGTQHIAAQVAEWLQESNVDVVA